MMMGAGTPSAMPTGNSVATVAPWLFTSTDSTNRARANVHGAVCTKPDTASFTMSICACINVSPSQAMPNMAITARIPAWNTEPLVTAWLSGLQNQIISAPAESITISMVCAMPSGFRLPASPNDGRSAGTAPITTTSRDAARNIPSDILAFLPITTLSSAAALSVSIAAAYCGSCRRFWYSGSSFSSLPILFTMTHASAMPNTVAGTVIFNTSPKWMPCGSR